MEGGRVIDHFKVIKPGDGTFALGQIVAGDDLEAENRRLKRNKKRQVQAEPHAFYVTAWEEEKYIIAQANAKIDERGFLENERPVARAGGDFRHGRPRAGRLHGHQPEAARQRGRRADSVP